MELVDIAISAIAESAASQKRFSWSGMVDLLGFLGAGYRWVHCGGPACGKDTTPFTGPSRRWNTGRCRTLLLPNSRGLHSSCARAVRQRVGCATNAQVQKNRWSAPVASRLEWKPKS